MLLVFYNVIYNKVYKRRLSLSSVPFAHDYSFDHYYVRSLLQIATVVLDTFLIKARSRERLFIKSLLKNHAFSVDIVTFWYGFLLSQCFITPEFSRA